MRTLIAILIVALCACVVQADVGVTYTDRVVVHGFKLFEDADAFGPQINVDVGPLGLDVRGLLETDSGSEKVENWDTQVSYRLDVGMVDLIAQYGYYYYPNSDLDFQELAGTVALPLGNLTPRYTAIHIDGDNDVEAAWLHVLGVDLDIGQVRCFGEVTYNYGFNPLGGDVDEGWSHVLAGAALDVPVIENIVATPAVYVQHTMEETVSDEENEVWFAVSLMAKF